MFAREYELIYVIRPDVADEETEKLVERTGKIITDAGGSILQVDSWGKRKLAYEIQKFNKGHFTRIHFLTDPTTVAELERILRIDDTTLRFLTVKLQDRVDVESRSAEVAAELALKATDSEGEASEASAGA